LSFSLFVLDKNYPQQSPIWIKAGFPPLMPPASHKILSAR